MMNIKYDLKLPVIATLVLLLSSCANDRQAISKLAPEQGQATLWLTTPDKTALLQEVSGGATFEDQTHSLPTIEIDDSKTFQTMDGFGFALTGGSAWLINQKLSPGKRSEVLQELFGTGKSNIGVSYLRISIGASDLDDKVFSYHDGINAKADVQLKTFSLQEDEKNLIPVLKEILKIRPDIKIMASPWSAPAWMKTNSSPRGGSLQPKYYKAYADYFVKYIQAMEKHGIPIDAITIQNEPENPNNNPSMVMTAAEQAAFVKENLGPAFTENGIKTKIVVFDHNCDHPEYPISILNDPDAKKYVDGSAFHLYLGKVDALSTVHEAHPDKSIYFTEQWTSPDGTFGGDLKWHSVNLTIGATRNWSRNVLEWNLAADPEFEPHTDRGGCTSCMGALTIDGDNVTRNVSYYIIGHASKFVTPGSVRIGSTVPDGFANVAFQRTDGKKVLLVVNEHKEAKDFAVSVGDKSAKINLPAGAVGTLTW
jgi:glucosylceramidase